MKVSSERKSLGVAWGAVQRGTRASQWRQGGGDWLTFFSSYYFIVSGLSVMGLRVEM